MSTRKSVALRLACIMASGFHSLTAPGQELLTLEQAQHLAVVDQPLVEAQLAAVEAQRQRAVAAGQLPDPELLLAVNDLPANGTDAWSFRRDADTDVMVGVMQEYPAVAKRRLRRLREEAAARRSGEALRDVVRLVRRDAGLGYADVYHTQRALEIIEAQLARTELQQKALRIRFTAGIAPQSEVLAADVEVGVLRDRVAEYRQKLAHERVRLSRWIGDAAHRELATALPSLPPAPGRDVALEAISVHPSLVAAERSAESARLGLDLALREYKPDWRVELGVGYRPEFHEMLTLRVAVDLPLFRRNRQDREAAAARQEVRAAMAHIEDRRRELATEAALAHHDWRVYLERLARFREDVLPAARSRVDAALETYGSGSGSLADVLLSQRALLDAELQSLALSVEALRSRVQLDYFLEQEDRP